MTAFGRQLSCARLPSNGQNDNVAQCRILAHDRNRLRRYLGQGGANAFVEKGAGFANAVMHRVGSLPAHCVHSSIAQAAR